jgi:thiamine biosynthesis lipoprotein
MLRILFLFLFFLAACQQQPETTQLNGSTMGTTWSVNMHSLPARLDPAQLRSELQSQLDLVNRLMSTYDPDSEISRFNRLNATDWFAISAETAEVIQLSQQVSELTGGAFDITVGPLVELWGFGAGERGETLPSDEQIAARLSHVGYQKLELRLQKPAIRKQHPQLQIDLSAVAKGYAVDLLAELLTQQGVENYLVEVGGELRIAGQRTDGTPWKIAIEKPDEETREVARIFPLTDTGLATSGNYRNFYLEDGQRYVHTIDPLSGRPIRHQLASATVLAADCARADALATALMVLGEEQGRKLVEAQGLATFFLIHAEDGLREYRSPAFERFLKQVQP